MTAAEATDMACRVRAINDTIAEHAEQDAELARERAGIIQVYRQEGWSLGAIAAETGLSRSRVAQIAGSTKETAS